LLFFVDKILGEVAVGHHVVALLCCQMLQRREGLAVNLLVVEDVVAVAE
jgi:hypothetical protein